MDYTRPKTVVFPPPPPTTNALTPAERSRLVRSSKKIARVLGATPRFLDSEVHFVRDEDDLYNASRTSINTLDTVSSCPTPISDVSISTTSSSLNRARKPLPLTPLQATWPAGRSTKPRLALETSLESIPASPLTPTSTIPSDSPILNATAARHRRSASLHGLSSFSCPEDRSESADFDSPELESSPFTPSFTLPTPAATRRRKLDRLRRTLGEDIPVRLIFSQTAESDSETESEPSLASSSIKTSSEDELITPGTSPISPTSPMPDMAFSEVEAKPIPRPRKKKIAHTRDSLVLSSSSSSSSSSPSKKKSSRVIVIPQASRPAPPPPTPSSPPSSLKKKATPKTSSKTTHSKSSTSSSKPNASQKPLNNNLRVYAHPPIVHHRSHSSGSSHSSSSMKLGLCVIMEEKNESEWYGSEDESDDRSYDFIGEDEVLGAVYGWGNHSALFYGGPPVVKGMGRGLAGSYGGGRYSRA